MNSDDHLDTVINDVARRMTEGAAAPDFTARVLQRVDERRTPRCTWRWVWVAGPLAAAAVVLIALQMVRLKPDATEGPSVVRLKRDATGAPSVVRLQPDATDVSSEVRLKPGATEVPSVVRLQPATEARSIDALAPPRLDLTPLDVAPLDASVTSPDSIEVEQLETIAPIAVTPLGTDDSQRPRPH